MARSTLYVYFDGKEDLLNQCIAQLRLGLGERVRQAVEEASGTEERLAAFLASHFEYVGLRARVLPRGDGGAGRRSVLLAARRAARRRSSRRSARRAGRWWRASSRTRSPSGEIPAENLPAALELLAVLIYGALMRRAQQAEPGPRRARSAAARGRLPVGRRRQIVHATGLRPGGETMATLKAGARLKSAVCDTQVMVIAVPAGDVALTCGGAAMLEPAANAARTADPSRAQERHADRQALRERRRQPRAALHQAGRGLARRRRRAAQAEGSEGAAFLRLIP